MTCRLVVPAFVLALAGCTEPTAGPAPPVPPTSLPASPPAMSSSVSSPPTEPPSSLRVRPAAIAGSWYPDSRALVTSDVAHLLRQASAAPSLAAKPVVLVVPHAGWTYSGAAAAAAYRTLHAGDYERVVIVGPSHESLFNGFAAGDEDAYATPLGQVPICKETAQLVDGTVVRTVPGADRREHSIEIELPFLHQTLGSFCMVPLMAGSTTPTMERELAAKLATLNDGKTLYVFSSDFVHYGPSYEYTPFGPTAKQAHARVDEFQARAIGLLESKDAAGFRKLLDATDATICGRTGLSVMLELLPRIAPQARAVLLARYASVDLPDSDGADGVWYVALAYVNGAAPSAKPAPPMGAPPGPVACTPASPLLDAASGQQLVRVARATLQTQLKQTGDLAHELSVLPTSPALDRLQAVFVTLNKDGDLRGCIGQLEPTYPLPQAVVRAALSAALDDPRFPPVTADELDSLTVEVTALTPSHPVASWKDIHLGKEGMVLELRGHRALFLPQVATEQGWTLEQTLGALSHKAGLPEAAWRDPEARFSVFSGQVFHEEKRGAASPAR